MVNMDVAIAYMDQLWKKGVTYSMAGSRTGVDGTADCSGTVYAALLKGGGQAFWLYCLNRN